MLRHMSLTLVDNAESNDYIAMLEHEFRPVDFRRVVSSQMVGSSEPDRIIIRWYNVTYGNASVLMKSLFEKDFIGSISFAEGKNVADAGRVVQSNGGITETIGVSVVRSKRLAE